MSPVPLPPEGAVLVLTDAPEEWGAAVADRNASGHRTALLVVAPDVDPEAQAEAMATEVFAGATWQLLDTRTGTPKGGPGMFQDT